MESHLITSHIPLFQARHLRSDRSFHEAFRRARLAVFDLDLLSLDSWETEELLTLIRSCKLPRHFQFLIDWVKGKLFNGQFLPTNDNQLTYAFSTLALSRLRNNLSAIIESTWTSRSQLINKIVSAILDWRERRLEQARSWRESIELWRLRRNMVMI